MGRLIPSLLVLLLILIMLAPSPAASASPQQQTATPIKHVVEIMMENHAFDNLFGTYPYINGFSGGNPYNLTVPLNLLAMNGSPVLNQLQQIPNGTYSSKNPIEGYTAYHGDWNNGMMNGFANNSGSQSMVYFTASQVAPLWDLAEQYSFADRYFASSLSETSPNRLYSLAGFSPVMNDYGPPPYISFNSTIFGQLQSSGIPWGYYTYNASASDPTLAYIQNIGAYQSEIQSWSSFYSELGNNTLPSVSFVMPVGGGASGYDMGSPNNLLKGEMWILYTIDKIMESPYWNSTAIFLTFDEGGGFYDQVAPPTLGGHQLGQRIPMILISPYAKENYISSTVMNHASILAFIEYNWKLLPLNRFVSLSNIPLDMFNFNSFYTNGTLIRPPVIFTAQEGFPVPQTAYFAMPQNPATLSNLFPLKPQIPFGELNYSRTGSSDVNLSQSYSTYYANSDTAIVPFFSSDYVIMPLLLLDIAVVVGAFAAARRRIK